MIPQSIFAAEYTTIISGTVIKNESVGEPSGDGSNGSINCTARSKAYDFSCVESITASSSISYTSGTLNSRYYYAGSLTLFSRTGTKLASQSTAGGTTSQTITLNIPTSVATDSLKGAHLEYTQNALIDASNWAFKFAGFSAVASGGNPEIPSHQFTDGFMILF